MSRRKKGLSARDRVLLDAMNATDMAERPEISESEAKLLAGYAEEHGHYEAAELFRNMVVPERAKRRR